MLHQAVVVLSSDVVATVDLDDGAILQGNPFEVRTI